METLERATLSQLVPMPVVFVKLASHHLACTADSVVGFILTQCRGRVAAAMPHCVSQPAEDGQPVSGKAKRDSGGKKTHSLM
eukprot:7313018-Lingulodinium_polyedra.AAC.1